MSEMVERVARALYGVYAENVPANLPYEQAGPHAQILAEKMARAAIAAMREPTEDIAAVGAEISWHDNWQEGHALRDTTMGEAWQAQIDEILK